MKSWYIVVIYIFIAIIFGIAVGLGFSASAESDCKHPELQLWEYSWLNDNLIRARDSHQRAFDSGNAYWMPLEAQKEWVVFYDRLIEINQDYWNAQ